MSCKYPKNIKKMNHAWEKLMEYAKEDKDKEICVAKYFNTMLNNMLFNGSFGLEGKKDPREDHRD